MALKILGFNGSPRGSASTALLIQKALEGARSVGAKTEYIDLHKVNFHPCVSCLMCKRGKEFEGMCHVQDGLIPYLKEIKKADGLIFGFPVYMGLPSGLFHGFIERALYSCYSYPAGTVFGRKIKTGMIVTMGAPQAAADGPYKPMIATMRDGIGQTYGSCDVMCACGLPLVTDYSKYTKGDKIDDKFTKYLADAYELGKRVATK